MTYQINKVGIIGAGTMGGGIAAHLANLGIPVVLLDIPTPNLSDEEKGSRSARNRMVQSLYKRMLKARPANLARKDRADLITVGNTQDDFDLISDCDWVVEVIIEQLAPKQSLMERLEATCKPGTIISSNTSGIPIHKIAEGRSEAFKKHFLGTHFFNPPRYLKLLEIIPTPDTDTAVVDFMACFGRDILGKGVVICKDTPNFIGNRFFAIAASFGIDYALKEGYSVPEIDAITGPLIGRPKTGTYRLMDLVGLDIMGHVNNNLYDLVPHDPYREILKAKKVTAVIGKMLDSKMLGNKSGQGFYKKVFVNGKREFHTLNTETFQYEAAPKARFESVGAVYKIEDLGERLRKLLEFDDRAANYVRHLLYYGFAYAAQVAPEIAYKLSDVDDAMRWGYSHEAGPFELWDMLGVADTIAKMEDAGYEIADWVKEMLANGHESFYGNGRAYDYTAKTYQPLNKDVTVILTKDLPIIDVNPSANLRDMGDGVALLEFQSKMNALDQDIISMGNKALERLNSDFDALVIGNNGANFSVGANLFAVAVAAQQGMWDQVEVMLKAGQQLVMDLRHAPKPVVITPHQMALGGGVEFTMHGWAAVADHETYMGLVEVGVGIIPSWGGCKEILRRKVNPVMRSKNADILPVLQEVFEQIALAKVGTSAWEAKELGYLRDGDLIVMNSDHRLGMAKRKALTLAASGQRPPEMEKIYAAGRDALYALYMGIQGFVWGKYASEHDALISRKLASVLCGGELSGPAWVDPWYILDLEREATLSLAGEPLTQARVLHMLQTGKPLRN